MLKKIWEFCKKNFTDWVMFAIAILLIYNFVNSESKKPVEFRDFKEGIQNHLVWSTKGECFYVRPVDDVMVHMVRVQDCDRK